MSATIVNQAARRIVHAPLWLSALLRTWRPLATRLALIALAVLATAQFVGAYIYLEFPYLDLYRFERGYERLPFQTRILVAPLYRWAETSPSVIAYTNRLARNVYFFPRGIRPGDVLEFFLDIACVLFAGWVATAIYRSASRRRLLQPLVFPLFLVLAVIAYILHTVQNFRYVYDMPSLAFFAAGFYLIYFRKPAAWFVAVFAVATLNRETILLLLPFYALSGALDDAKAQGRFHWQALFKPGTLAVVLPLAVYWLAWHHVIFSIFATNASEYYPRIPFNLRCFLRLRYYPQLFSALGFLGPFLFLGRRYVADLQLRLWLWTIPIWYAFMFTWAILVETRVFGELIPFLTVYTAIMAEEWLAARLYGGRNLAELPDTDDRPALVSRTRRAA